MVPSVETINTIAREMKILSQVQAAEVLESVDFATLSWDGTDCEGKKLNEVHMSVSTSDGIVSYLLQIAQVPGGTTDDNVDAIITSITDVANVYAEWTNRDPSDVFQEIIKKFKSAVTDRVNVNGAVLRALESRWNTSILKLNCQVHPQDLIAKCSRDALKLDDKNNSITSTVHGSSAIADNLMRGIHRFQTNQRSGDPKGFRILMKKLGLTKYSYK